MEKRRFPRFSFKEPVGYLRTEGLPENGSLGEDLSPGGVRIRVPEFIPLRTVLNLKIHLNNPVRVMDVKGQVVWVRQVPYSDTYDIGIQFFEQRRFDYFQGERR